MRLSHPLPRALVSICFVVGLVTLLLLAPATPSMNVEARPLQQQPAVNLTVDSSTKTGDRGALVTYTFTITTSNPTACTSNNYAISVTGSSFNPVNPSSIAVGPGASATFTVQFRVAPNAAPGDTDEAIVRVTCQGDATISDAERVVTTVTINGNTPTATPNPTTTPTVSVTPTSTGTVGPTPTPGPVCRDNFEPNDSISLAREIRPDVPQTHVICPAGDEDFLFFGGVAGKVHTIDVAAVTQGLDLSLSLYDSAGNLLAFNDDFPRDNNAGDIKPRIQSWRVPANGTYYIKVRDNAGRGGTNLSYTVALQSESYGPTPTLVAELCTDLFEPDGVPEEASLLVVREIQPDHRFCPSGDADWVRFFAKAGQPFTLSVTSGVPGSDPVMILVDRDGSTILDFNDDSGGTLDPQIQFTVLVDGFYYAQLKNVGDIGSQFIRYTLSFQPSGVAGPAPTTPTTETTTATTTTATATTPTTTATTTTATTTTTTGTTTTTATTTATVCTTPGTQQTPTPYPPGCVTATPSNSGNGTSSIKGAPAFVNGPTTDFVDPALKSVWSRTDQVVAARQVDRSWMWGPGGLMARVEVYTQSNGGARQVEYFDKARMEITDWQRDRTNPWFVTNGLLVKELIDGQLQIGDSEFLKRPSAAINVAGDADDANGPTYASFAPHAGRAASRIGQIATETLRRDGSTGTIGERPEARLAMYVPETGHNIPQVFWDFLNTRGPVGDGSRTDLLVDWTFAMGYPISEPYWTTVKVGGVEKEVLVQAFQRRVLTYTPTNPAGWQVEMGNVGRHYYVWRYGKQP